MRFQPKSCASTLTEPKRCEGRTGRREEQPLPKIAAPREAQDHGVNRNERPGDGSPKSRRQQSARQRREGVQQDVLGPAPLRRPITSAPANGDRRTAQGGTC